jgi:hypothetical protein
MLNDAVATLLDHPESAARTVKVNVPTVVGVPEIVPSAASERPAGNAPPTTCPLVDPASWYQTATMPFGAGGIEATNTGGLIVRESANSAET